MRVKKFKVQVILDLDYKKKNDCKIFHSSTKLIVKNSDIDEAFKSIHQSNMTRIKNYTDKDCIVVDVVIKHSTKTFEF